MQATVEYEPIVKKLLEKSEQGRLNWEKSPLGGFFCEIEGEYTFESKRIEDGYELTMDDSGGDVIFSSISGEEAIVYDDPKKEELFNMLRDLYEFARKKALNVDEKIATATGLLDRI
jgi:hypothetical protein